MGTGTAPFTQLEFSMGCLGWTKANKERKRAGGGDRAVPPTGNSGLGHRLDCGCCDHTARSSSKALNPALGTGAEASYNMASGNKHNWWNWQRCNGKKRDRKHQACRWLTQARDSQPLSALNCAWLYQHLPPMGMELL